MSSYSSVQRKKDVLFCYCCQIPQMHTSGRLAKILYPKMRFIKTTSWALICARHCAECCVFIRVRFQLLRSYTDFFLTLTWFLINMYVCVHVCTDFEDCSFWTYLVNSWFSYHLPLSNYKSHLSQKDNESNWVKEVIKMKNARSKHLIQGDVPAEQFAISVEVYGCGFSRK